MRNMHYEVRDALAFANAVPQPVGRVGIIGATAPGVGIAMNLLAADVPVTLFELDRDSLDKGIALARSGCEDAVAKGMLAATKRDRRMALLAGTVNFHHLKDCDLIIEAVCTDTLGTQKLFHRLDQVAKPGAILMTHASHACIDHVADCTKRPGDVLGLHFPSPGIVSGMWELMCGKQTSAQAVATVITLARMLHEVASVSDGYHSSALDLRSAAQLRDQRSVTWQIDQALE